MSLLLIHLRTAFRQLSRRPGLSLLSVFILALGLAPLVASWSLYRRVEAPKQAYASFEDLAWLEARHSSDKPGEGPGALPYSLYPRLLEQAPIQALCAMESGRVFQKGSEDSIQACKLDPAIFEMLGLKPSQGRPLRADDAKVGAAPVAVLTERGWRNHFGADPSIIGRIVELDGEAVQIVGVFEGHLPGDALSARLLLPLGKLHGGYKPFQNKYSPKPTPDPKVQMLARLKPGWSRDRATQALKGLSDQLAQERPDFNKTQIFARGLEQKRDRLLLMFVLAFGLPTFIVACAAVSALLLAQSTIRQNEVAIKTALGAPRLRLMFENLVPTLLLCLPAVLLAWAPARAIQNQLAPGLPSQNPDPWLFVGLALIALLGALGAGLLPAWLGSRANLLDMMGKGSSNTARNLSKGWPRVLVSLQLSVSLALMGLSLMVFQTYRKAVGVSPFPNWRHTAHFAFPIPPEANHSRFLQEMKVKISALPGVEGLALYTGDILPSVDKISPTVQTPEGRSFRVSRSVGEPAAIDLIGLKLKGGRMPQGEGEVLISLALAEKLGGSSKAMGLRLELQLPHREEAAHIMVVGITESPKDFQNGGSDVPWMLEWSLCPHPELSRFYGLASLRHTDPASIEAFNRTLEELAQTDKVFVSFTQRWVQLNLEPHTHFIYVLGALGLLALILALSGMAALTHLMVERRKKEMGLRSALGATQGALLRQILKESFWMVIGGAPLGLMGAWLGAFGVVSRISSVKIKAFHLTELLLLLSALLIAILFAAFAPALRASRVDPAEALRED